MGVVSVARGARVEVSGRCDVREDATMGTCEGCVVVRWEGSQVKDASRMVGSLMSL